MARDFAVGDRVQTALGKGVVREIRNRGRMLVEVNGRAMVFDAPGVRLIDPGARPGERQDNRAAPADAEKPNPTKAHGTRAPGPAAGAARVREADLHGCTVEEALSRVDALLDACMREDIAHLRLIHGRSGGRLKSAVHRRLAAVSSVRAFSIDPDNPGVTIVFL